MQQYLPPPMYVSGFSAIDSIRFQNTSQRLFRVFYDTQQGCCQRRGKFLPEFIFYRDSNLFQSTPLTIFFLADHNRKISKNERKNKIQRFHHRFLSDLRPKNLFQLSACKRDLGDDLFRNIFFQTATNLSKNDLIDVKMILCLFFGVMAVV